VPWEPEAEVWKSYARRLDKEYHREKKRYRSFLEGQINKRKLARNKREQSQHFDWFIDYQIPQDGQTMTEEEVTEKYQDQEGLALSTVSDGIYSIGYLIGIRPRPPKRTRPEQP